MTDKPKSRRVQRRAPRACSASDRLRQAEDILGDLATGFWVSILDMADGPVSVRMGQRVLRYWQIGDNDEGKKVQQG